MENDIPTFYINPNKLHRFIEVVESSLVYFFDNNNLNDFQD